MVVCIKRHETPYGHRTKKSSLCQQKTVEKLPPPLRSNMHFSWRIFYYVGGKFKNSYT